MYQPVIGGARGRLGLRLELCPAVRHGRLVGGNRVAIDRLPSISVFIGRRPQVAHSPRRSARQRYEHWGPSSALSLQTSDLRSQQIF